MPVSLWCRLPPNYRTADLAESAEQPSVVTCTPAPARSKRYFREFGEKTILTHPFKHAQQHRKECGQRTENRIRNLYL